LEYSLIHQTSNAQTDEQTLRMDEPVDGRLASNDGIAFWDFQAEAGMIVSVDLESDDFDTVMALFNDQDEIVIDHWR